MELKELRKKETTELKRMVFDLKKKISEIRFKQASNQLKNVNETRLVRREIAQILTVINEKEKHAR